MQVSQNYSRLYECMSHLVLIATSATGKIHVTRAVLLETNLPVYLQPGIFFSWSCRVIACVSGLVIDMVSKLIVA